MLFMTELLLGEGRLLAFRTGPLLMEFTLDATKRQAFRERAKLDVKEALHRQLGRYDTLDRPTTTFGWSFSARSRVVVRNSSSQVWIKDANSGMLPASQK
jgi:hypothetical protein